MIGEQTIFADPVDYANLFVRCSQAPAARTATIGACHIPGGDPLAYIVNTNQNLGITKTSGFDFQANWQGSATQYGTFNIGLRSTYVKNYDFQVVASGGDASIRSAITARSLVARSFVTSRSSTFGWNYGTMVSHPVQSLT